MSSQSSLERYSNARKALQDHIDANREVFAKAEMLDGNIMDMRNAVEEDVITELEAAKQSGTKYNPPVTADHRVLIATRKSYDEDKLRDALKMNPALITEIIRESPQITIGRA